MSIVPPPSPAAGSRPGSRPPSRRSAGGAPGRVRHGGEQPVVGPREPCPCGSGRRYKACHGRADRTGEPRVARPFLDLPGEPEWVALREFVPAGTAPLRLTGEAAAMAAGRPVVLATVLPLAWPAWVRPDGRVFVSVQAEQRLPDLSRDIAATLLAALVAPPGPVVEVDPAPAGPRLGDLVGSPIEVTVHPDFGYWTDGLDAPVAGIAESLERANAAVLPTVRLSSVGAAYWCQVRDRAHLRWVMPYEEEPLLDGLARLAVAGGIGIGDRSRFAGSFRAYGLVVPVWDLPQDTTAGDIDGAAAQLHDRLAAAVSATGPLTAAERRARAGLRSRQVTIR